MRILMLAPHPSVRGPIPKHTPLLVRALGDLGCEVITGVWGRHHDNETAGGRTIGRLKDIAKARRRLKQEQFDVLVIKTAHDWATLFRDIPLLLATRQLARATVVQFHGSEPQKLLGPGHDAFKKATSRMIRMCDAAMVLSSEEAREWQLFYPEGKFFVVSNPRIPVQTNVPSATSNDWNLPQGVPVLLYASRLIAEKGIFDLLEAVARIKDRTAVHLLIAGAGPQAQQVRERVKTFGLEKHATMAGHLEGDALANAYKAADIFVLPTYYAEGFPTAITEAMSAALPIVTTSTRGIADHLRDGEHAVFVPQRDPAALAEALTRLLADPVLSRAIAQASREEVLKFAPEIVGRQYLQVLTEVLKSKAGRSTSSMTGRKSA
jgi:glycosyltransferase involved in cell wall biosynthesis